MSKENVKPNEKEKVALNLLYNRFYDLYNEICNDEFFAKDPILRFYKIRDTFSVYKELLGYKPLKYYLNYMKLGARPPLEGVIADDLFSFIRNMLLHFPIFDTWDDAYITKDLATWNQEGTIHKFLLKCTKIKIDRKGTIKYRIWSHQKKKMTYITINLPEQYNNSSLIYLKNIISEKDGVLFSIALMKKILDTQVESNDTPDFSIMSHAYFLKY